MEFDIVPFIGVGPLHFGMTPDETHTIMGTPSDTRILRYPDSAKKERRETYPSGMHLVFTAPATSARLVEFVFWDQCRHLRYDEMELFRVTPRLDVVRRLAAKDPDVKVTFSILVFLKLGIALTGFHDGEESDLSVSVFESGRWDEHMSSMKPFLIPE
jgi:hypothetical protein